MRRSAAPAVVLAFSALFAVSACAAAGAPSPSGSGPHGSDPSATATTSGAPAFAYDLGCADLLTSSEAQAQLMAPVSDVVDESTPRVVDLPLAQSFGITCLWGGADRTDGMYNDSVTVTVLPEAADGFTAWSSTARNSCSPDQPICTVDRLAGRAWLRVELSAEHGSPAPIAEEANQVVQKVAGRIEGARARPSQWTMRVGALHGIADCAAAAAKAGEAAGFDAAVLPPAPSPDLDSPDLDALAIERSGYSRCSWSSVDHSHLATWAVLPGGGWAFETMSAAHPPTYGWGITLHPATITGADAAWTGCGPSCAVIAEVNGSLVTIDLDAGLDESALDRAAEAMIEAFSS